MNTQLHPEKIGRYLDELSGHCRAALIAFTGIKTAVDTEPSCQMQFLKEVENIEALLRNRKNRKYGKEIRSIFSIAENSPLFLKNEAEPSNLLPLFLAVRGFYASLQKYEEFRACFEILKNDPDHVSGLFQKSVLLFKCGRHEEALELSDRLLELVPQDYKVWYNRGVILAGLGRADAALAAYEKTSELEPGFLVALDNKGVVLSKLGRYEEALETYETVLSQNPDYAEAWAGKGAVLSALDRKDAALEAYERALDLRPEYLEALAGNGMLLAELGRLEAARDTYDRALLISPEDPKLWYNRGLVMHRLKEYEEALRNYNRTLELSPGFGPALENKVGVLSEISRIKKRSVD